MSTNRRQCSLCVCWNRGEHLSCMSCNWRPRFPMQSHKVPARVPDRVHPPNCRPWRRQRTQKRKKQRAKPPPNSQQLEVRWITRNQLLRASLPKARMQTEKIRTRKSGQWRAADWEHEDTPLVKGKRSKRSLSVNYWGVCSLPKTTWWRSPPERVKQSSRNSHPDKQ